MQSISKKLDNKVINSVNGLQSRKVNNPEEGNYPSVIWLSELEFDRATCDNHFI